MLLLCVYEDVCANVYMCVCLSVAGLCVCVSACVV